MSSYNIYNVWGDAEDEYLHAFSFFRKPIQNTEPLRCIRIPDVYRYIVGPYAKRQTQELRNIADTKMARKYKAENFDFCTFSGIFRNRNRDSLLLHSEMLCIDFDHVTDIPSLREKLLNDEYFNTELLFISPSGDGLKWVIDIDRKGWEHDIFYNAVFNYLMSNGYPEPDKSGKDVARSCFLPYDPNIYINPKYSYELKENFFSRRLDQCPY